MVNNHNMPWHGVGILITKTFEEKCANSSHWVGCNLYASELYIFTLALLEKLASVQILFYKTLIVKVSSLHTLKNPPCDHHLHFLRDSR